MGRNSLRDQMSAKLKQRTEESHDRASGAQSRDYFDPAKTSGISKWWAGKGEHIIDIIPYIAGKHDPFNKEGSPAYVLDVEVHQKVGVAEENVVCPVQFKLPCPICEDMRAKRDSGLDYKTEVKPLLPKRRTAYNVIVRDGGAMEKKGVQIFEISHFFMEKHLAKISKDARTGGYVVFSDPNIGKSVTFERTGVGAENTGYDGHRFSERPEPITDEELDAAHCLDELLKLHTYEEIYKMHYGVSAPRDTASNFDEPDADSDVCPDCGNDPCTCSQVPEKEEAAPAPSTPPRRSAAEKREASQRRSGASAPACPAGGTIGKDIDDFEACDTCTLYDKCAELA